MPLLIIQPDFTSEGAHEWLVDVFVQILELIEPDEPATDDLAYQAKVLSYKDMDAIFEKAMKGLLE